MCSFGLVIRRPGTKRFGSEEKAPAGHPTFRAPPVAVVVDQRNESGIARQLGEVRLHARPESNRPAAPEIQRYIGKWLGSAAGPACTIEKTAPCARVDRRRDCDAANHRGGAPERKSAARWVSARTPVRSADSSTKKNGEWLAGARPTSAGGVMPTKKNRPGT